MNRDHRPAGIILVDEDGFPLVAVAKLLSPVASSLSFKLSLTLILRAEILVFSRPFRRMRKDLLRLS